MKRRTKARSLTVAALGGCASPARFRIARCAMTLLEVLTVTVVISALVGLLVPALGRARESGRSAVCTAALHSAGLAMTLYLEDNEHSFWPYYVDISGPDGGRQWWFGFEEGGPSPSTQGRRPLDKSRGFLARYLTGGTPDLLCPSFPYGHGKTFTKFSPPAGGYGYNTAGLGGYDWINPGNIGPRKLRDVRGQPADVFCLADGIHFDRLDYSSSPPLSQGFNEPAYIQWQWPNLFGSNAGVNGGFGHFRHLQRANVMYLDGHVAGQPVRRPPHPFSKRGYGPVANLSDDALRTTRVRKGQTDLDLDVIYGLP